MKHFRNRKMNRFQKYKEIRSCHCKSQVILTFRKHRFLTQPEIKIEFMEENSIKNLRNDIRYFEK